MIDDAIKKHAADQKSVLESHMASATNSASEKQRTEWTAYADSSNKKASDVLKTSLEAQMATAHQKLARSLESTWTKQFDGALKRCKEEQTAAANKSIGDMREQLVKQMNQKIADSDSKSINAQRAIKNKVEGELDTIEKLINLHADTQKETREDLEAKLCRMSDKVLEGRHAVLEYLVVLNDRLSVTHIVRSLQAEPALRNSVQMYEKVGVSQAGLFDGEEDDGTANSPNEVMDNEDTDATEEESFSDDEGGSDNDAGSSDAGSSDHARPAEAAHVGCSEAQPCPPSRERRILGMTDQDRQIIEDSDSRYAYFRSLCQMEPLSVELAAGRAYKCRATGKSDAWM